MALCQTQKTVLSISVAAGAMEEPEADFVCIEPSLVSAGFLDSILNSTCGQNIRPLYVGAFEANDKPIRNENDIRPSCGGTGTLGTLDTSRVILCEPERNG